MSERPVAIKVEHISKRYRLGLKDEMHDSFGAMVVDALKSPLKNYKKYRSLYKFEDDNDSESVLWALRDVSFDVKEGEVLGIIGGNGAGKSTLLKVLSRITEPSSGRVEIHGRIGSLLEVGTGFNPELSGRDNVYLNGVVLGMRKKEVDARFDEIVAFSGIEKFIDTPIKRYSSGMKVRLAFAVAAHLEPEILIVDEVLAVGDDEFQRKCLGKMSEVSQSGRTVFFVSHTMSAVNSLCSRVIWMKAGQVNMDGSPAEVIGAYLSASAHAGLGNAVFCGENPEGPFRLQRARVFLSDEDYVPAVNYDQTAKIAIRYEVAEPIKNLVVNIVLSDSLGNSIFASSDSDTATKPGNIRAPGVYESVCVLPSRMMRPGRYFVSIRAFEPKVRGFCVKENAMAFEVTDVNFPLNPIRPGVIMPVLDWTVSPAG